MLRPKVPSLTRGGVAALALTAFIAANGTPAVAVEDSGDLSGTVGIGVAALPDYEGSDDYRVLPLPIFDLQYKSFFANFRNGIGAFLVDTDQFEVGAGAVFVRGRRAKDSPEGVGKVKDTVGGRVFASYQPLDNLSLTAGVTQAFGGPDGTLVDVGASFRLRPSQRLMLIPAVTATWASDKHNSAHFGISPTQSARSGLPVFDADAGFKDVSMALVALYALNEKWHLTGTGVVARYLGDTADSPLNEHKWQPAVIVGVGYRF